jgi:hypothetical protein
MYDGQLARPASAEGQLAVGNNCGEGVGAHDHCCCAAIGVRQWVVARGADAKGIAQCKKRKACSHLTR